MAEHPRRAFPPLAALAVPLLWAVAASACSRSASRDAPPPSTVSEAKVPAALLSVGATAPRFDVVAHNGRRVTLDELRGHPVVLYFYPKDDTPGCTREACELRDIYTEIEKTGAVVLGVSTQDNGTHKQFADKHRLPFPLVPDVEGRLSSSFGVPIEGGLAKRITFLIGRDGRVAKVWPAVSPAGHAAEVLESLRALPGS